MERTNFGRSAARWLAAGAGLAAAGYGTYAAATWYRYGNAKRPRGKDADPLLDTFMPTYEVAERHRIYVAAPAGITLAAACEMDLERSAIVRAIFKTRGLILGSQPQQGPLSQGLLELTKALGWGILAERPEREIVVGAVTQPWAANPVFRALAPDKFAAFEEPGYAKIAWTLRADPISDAESIFRTESRVVTTDPEARAKFRRYWSFVAPGVILIRRMTLCPLKREAERRAREAAQSQIALARG